MTDPHPAARQTQAIVSDLAKIAPRIDTALTQLARDAIPLRAASGTGLGGTSDYADPTTAALGLTTHSTDPDHTGHWTPPPDPATERRRLLNTIRNLREDVDTIAAIVNRNAAIRPGKKQLDAENAQFWCKNHRVHGCNEPSREDGGRHCRWCLDTLRNYGKLPTSGLIKLRATGRRLSEQDYERELGVKRKKQPA
jgi:hypothetical protein